MKKINYGKINPAGFNLILSDITAYSVKNIDNQYWMTLECKTDMEIIISWIKIVSVHFKQKLILN